LIGGLDAEAEATADKRSRNFAKGEAARRAGKPRAMPLKRARAVAEQAL